MGVEIHMAHTSFKWANLASHNAGVTVIVVGLSQTSQPQKKLLDEVSLRWVDLIGPYLVPGTRTIVQAVSKPVGRPKMIFGNKPVDGGNLILSFSQRQKTSIKQKFIRPLFGSSELIRGLPRFCIWISDEYLTEALENPELRKRVDACKQMRLASTDLGARELAKRAHQFREMNSSIQHSICMPCVSSENRNFLPVSLQSSKSVLSNLAFGMHDADIFYFSVLASRLHLIWIATVCGKLKTDFRYSNTLGWNTFPLPELMALQKDELTARAEEILLVRERHFPKSIAQLYDPEAMPQDLRDAHRRNDEVLEHIYIGRPFKNDTERLEHLFKLYAKMVGEEAAETGAKAVK